MFQLKAVFVEPKSIGIMMKIDSGSVQRSIVWGTVHALNFLLM